ncbi:hypothetical protein FVE85_3098 [Porphyridium purpureum]|uniref:Uncharacterized protein n=1 Tax=Porphyridium purpureum TaxID=35688 RepID=A0A5J4YWN4_PORPP|nr:hypothetical protein FVE85_3098 [Porphyridium purpureum]|eukprot:POR5423..scf227_4
MAQSGRQGLERLRSVKEMTSVVEITDGDSTAGARAPGQTQTQRRVQITSVTDKLMQQFQEAQRAAGTEGSMLTRSEKPPVVPYEILGMDGNLLLQFLLACMAFILVLILLLSINVTQSLEAKLVSLQRASRRI